MTRPLGARDVARRRLRAQALVGPPLGSPVDVVRHLGAVQSQELAAARWSVAQRSAADDTAVLAAYDRGEILRTHVLRPTWHFVPAEDVCWMQALTADRVRRQDGVNARRTGVDEAMVSACLTVFARVLAGGRALTRAELKDALAVAGVEVMGPQLSHLTLRAELDGLLTSGPVRGRFPTFALLEERVPDARELEPDEALGELTTRYFRSHGPATERDYAWWSGLPLTAVRRGLTVARGLESVEGDGEEYWFDPATAAATESAGALMIQSFDEYVVAYSRTRRVAYDEQPTRSTNPNTFLQPLLVDGQVVGSWRRGTGRDGHLVRVSVPEAYDHLVEAEVARYAAFLGVPPLEVERLERPVSC
jgi:hypothetical protein